MVRVLAMVVLALVTGPAYAKPSALSSVTVPSLDEAGNGRQQTPPPPPQPHRQPRPMTEGEMQGVGCLASTAAATAITYTTNPVELALVIAGGSVVPTTPAILFLAVTGTISLAACGMGAIMTPAAVWMYEERDAIFDYFHDTLYGAPAAARSEKLSSNTPTGTTLRD